MSRSSLVLKDIVPDFIDKLCLLIMLIESILLPLINLHVLL